MASPTINLNDSIPAAPANGINVKWQAVPSVHDVAIENVSAAIVGPGGTSDFLRADGAWAPAGGSGAAYANLATLPYMPISANLADWTYWVRIPASGLLIPSTTKIKVGVLVASGTLVIGSAVIRRADAFGTSFIDSIPVTWSGVSNPSLGVGLQLSDEISIVADVNHDLWVLIHTDPSNTGYFAESTAPNFGTGYQGFDAHRGYGDQTTTAMASLTVNADYLGIIAQILGE